MTLVTDFSIISYGLLIGCLVFSLILIWNDTADYGDEFNGWLKVPITFLLMIFAWSIIIVVPNNNLNLNTYQVQYSYLQWRIMLLLTLIIIGSTISMILKRDTGYKVLFASITTICFLLLSFSSFQFYKHNKDLIENQKAKSKIKLNMGSVLSLTNQNK